jgi:hypothetical protein
MQLKDIDRLRKNLNEICSKRIDGIIEQMIANQNALIAATGDEAHSLKESSLYLKMILTVEDSTGQPVEIGNFSSAIEMK